MLNAAQKYYRMLKWDHSVILSTFIKLPFIINIFVLSIFEWPFYTGFTVHQPEHYRMAVFMGVLDPKISTLYTWPK